MIIEDNVRVPKLCFMVELVDAPGNIVPTVLETWDVDAAASAWGAAARARRRR